MRRVVSLTVVALTVVALAVVALALGAVVGEPGTSAASDTTEPTLVEVGETQLWPYVGPDPSFDRRASPINVVVRDDPESVRRYLAGRRGWNRSDAERVADASNETAVVADEHVPWRDAPGAPRYAYVAGRGWTTERYQLHRGDYFGSRHHLRAYGPRNGDWTAVQAHAEHWDWFTITHTVDSVEVAQRRVESAFLGEARFEVRRIYHDNGDTYDADGWTTVVAAALAPLLVRRRLRSLARRFGAVAGRRNRRRVALAGVLAALPLAVRYGGLLCERFLPWLSHDAVVALWYPVLVVGVPLAAVGFGRRLPPAEAGALAALGVGAGILLDYTALGMAVLPVPVAVHRVGVVVAVGLLAAGAGPDDGAQTRAQTESGRGVASRDEADDRRWTAAFRTGAVLWVVVVAAGHLV